VRLGYFNVFGLAECSTYRGLALDNNALLLVLLFVAQPLMAPAVFAGVLYAGLIGLAALNIAPISTPKFGGNWFYAVVGYAVAISAVLLVRIG
jgi:phosphatidylserine synthase